MSMIDWAENEIRLACEKERQGCTDKGWNYGVACYESALKAYKALCEDNHSGFSWGITFGILTKLCRNEPLMPIEDTDDVWNKVSEGEYQCRRMSSLFKDVHEDGSVSYSDTNRIVCVNIYNSNDQYHSGLVTRLINEMKPIKLPYVPEKLKVYCEEFLSDKHVYGDFDTVGVFYMVDADDKSVDINRFFKESDNEFGWEEIKRDEYCKRRAISLQREETSQ